MIDLFILGFLERMGPQHGYRLRQAIRNQTADFADIKLPTIYYHLTRLEKRGLVTSRSESAEPRPERTIYYLTPAGRKELAKLAQKALEERYFLHFGIDAAFYFVDALQPAEVHSAVKRRIENVKKLLEEIQKHHSQVIPRLDAEAGLFAGIIFDHHIEHCKAELCWLEDTIKKMSAGDQYK